MFFVINITNKRLILDKKTEQDPSSTSNFGFLYSLKKCLRSRKSLFIFVVFLVPFFANASIFSFLNINTSSSSKIFELLGEEYVYIQNSSHINSQTTPLLKAAVHNDPNPAKGGGEIVVVDDTALQAQPSFSEDGISIYKPKNDQISVYEVREGDTLSQIAEMFHVSANTIRWANDLEGAIQPGQTLVILPVTGVKHVIKKGGTVSDLAKIYNADAKEIALFNGIALNTNLKPGDEVVVPNGEIVSTGKSSKSRSSRSRKSGSFLSHPLPGGVKTQGFHGNNAIDVGASVGSPIYAAASGQVIISRSGGWNGGYGNYIVIKHDNGVQTLYSHNSRNSVAVGQWVDQGQLIGYVGSTGKSTGPHLHFEVRGATNPF